VALCPAASSVRRLDHTLDRELAIAAGKKKAKKDTQFA
jgi:hypothetical protein